MTGIQDVSALPTFTALDGYAVLAGTRRGASIQFDGTYFDGQLRALEALEEGSEALTKADRERRSVTLRTSRDRFERIDVDIDSLTDRNLWTASNRLRRQFQRLGEISYLEHAFPERCFVVPEWVKTGNRLHYGARVYFFRSGDSPAPADVIQKNIDAIQDAEFEQFERYQGRLHGYPDCCIDYYHERSPAIPAPEWRAIEPFLDRINAHALKRGSPIALDDLLPGFDEWPDRHAFFAREFFPEPGCDAARETGRAIYDSLSDGAPSRLAEEYFRLTFGYSLLVARAVHTGGSHRPAPGALGRTHLEFYLPLRELLAKPRYS